MSFEGNIEDAFNMYILIATLASNLKSEGIEDSNA